MDSTDLFCNYTADKKLALDQTHVQLFYTTPTEI